MAWNFKRLDESTKCFSCGRCHRATTVTGCGGAVAQVVAHWITEREVRSSIPTGTRALSISSLSYLYQSVVCPLKGPLWWCNTTDFNLPTKMKAYLCSLRRSKLNMHNMRKNIRHGLVYGCISICLKLTCDRVNWSESI